MQSIVGPYFNHIDTSEFSSVSSLAVSPQHPDRHTRPWTHRHLLLLPEHYSVPVGLLCLIPLGKHDRIAAGHNHRLRYSHTLPIHWRKDVVSSLVVVYRPVRLLAQQWNEVLLAQDCYFQVQGSVPCAFSNRAEREQEMAELRCQLEKLVVDHLYALYADPGMQ